MNKVIITFISFIVTLGISVYSGYAQETLQSVTDMGYTIETARAGSANGFKGAIQTISTAPDCWGMLTMPDYKNAAGPQSYWFIGRGNSYAERVMSFHIPTYQDYGNSGNIPKFKFVMSGDLPLFTIDALGGACASGKMLVGSTDWSEAPYHNAIVAGNVTYPNDVTNSQLAITGQSDGRKQLALGYDTNGNGFGFIAAGYRGITWTNLALQPNGGNVGIGIINPSEKLSVNGKIRAKEIKVEAANWPDYVFTPDHEKLSLTELNAYIRTNRHLPEIPSAKEIESDGLSLGEMNARLLKKVEELTLYLIEKDEELKLEKLKNEKQQDALSNQQERLDRLEAAMNGIKSR